MAYQRHDKDNNPVAISPYVRHDENNAVDTPHADYLRHDEDNVLDVSQPAHMAQIDVYGNPYKDWNQDYVEHDVTNNPV